MQKASPTRLLVRDARSQRFLKSTGRWTRKPEAASNFPNVVNAINTCLASGARQVELILRFEGDQDDLRVAVNCR